MDKFNIGEKVGKLTVVKQIIDSNNQKRWACKCDCGNPSFIYVKSYQLNSGHTQSCGCLRSNSVSIGELTIAKWLNKEKIKYEKEKTFSKCIGIGGKHLRFDFYLPDYNLCIEYNGIQHDMPIAYFGGMKRFKLQCENDKIKKDYCKKHGIDLYIISYKTKQEDIIQNIKSIIQNPVTIKV